MSFAGSEIKTVQFAFSGAAQNLTLLIAASDHVASQANDDLVHVDAGAFRAALQRGLLLRDLRKGQAVTTVPVVRKPCSSRPPSVPRSPPREGFPIVFARE